MFYRHHHFASSTTCVVVSDAYHLFNKIKRFLIIILYSQFNIKIVFLHHYDGILIDEIHR